MRKFLPFVAVAIALGLATGCVEPASQKTTASLSEHLRLLTADRGQSYQRLLRDATHEVRVFALDRPWSDVEPALRRQGLRKIRSRDNQHTIDYRYLVSKNGWRGGDQSEHMLFLEFSVDKRSTNNAANARPGFVITAEAGLLVEPNIPYPQALTNGTYPDASFVSRGLRLPEVAAAAQSYPMLKRIEVTYDFIRDRWSESVAQGFILHLSFGNSAHEERPCNRLFFSADSGLDAVQDRYGRPLLQQFESKDTVGEFRSWGSVESK